jgi:hypothetical protein
MTAFYQNVFAWQTQQLGPDVGAYVLVTTTATADDDRPAERGAINGGFFSRSADARWN